MAVAKMRDLTPAEDPRYARAVQARAAHARRDTIFAGDAELFGDPAWDILLALYVASADGQRAPVSDIGLSAHVSSATALRHLQELAKRGLVERTEQRGSDRALCFDLSQRGRAALDRCFAG